MDLDLDTNTTRSMDSYVSGKLDDAIARTYVKEPMWKELVNDGNGNALDKALSHIAARRGLYKLSNEIIFNILVLVVNDFKTAVGLSGVCQRFRVVMLTSPRIWANCEASICLSRKNIKLLTLRSHELPLRCEISMLRSTSSQDMLLTQVTRIWSLSISWSKPVGQMGIHQKYDGLELPNLRHLTINGDYSSETDPDTRHFYEDWKMPKLQRMTCKNYIPFPVHAASLTICTLEFYCDKFDVGKLVSFLSSSYQLHTLSMRFDIIFSEHVVESNKKEGRSSPTFLEGLRSLQIESRWPVSITLFERLGTSLIFPNLTDLSLVHDHKHGGSWSNPKYGQDKEIEYHLLKCLLPIGPSVRNVSISLSEPIYKYPSDCENPLDLDYGSLLCDIPANVAIISLTAPGHRLTMDWSKMDAESYIPQMYLISLRFCDCNMMSRNFLEKLQKDLDEFGADIPEVEIERCKNIKKLGLDAVFPNSRITYKP